MRVGGACNARLMSESIIIPEPVVNRHLCREYPVSLAELEGAIEAFTKLSFDEVRDSASSVFDDEDTVEVVTTIHEQIQESWFPGYRNSLDSNSLFTFLDSVVMDSVNHFFWTGKLVHRDVTSADDVSQFHYLSKLADDRISFKEDSGNTVVRYGYDVNKSKRK